MKMVQKNGIQILVKNRLF